MPKSSVNASLSSYDDIFSTEESRQEEQREQVRQIPIGELFPFKNHPFKVLDDDSMSDTVESVKQYGVLSPLIARVGLDYLTLARAAGTLSGGEIGRAHV